MSASKLQSRSPPRGDDDEALPRVAAVFVAKFDQHEGYKLMTSRSLPGVEVEDVVAFKSFPSGLHKVKKDLIYFLHGEHAGISAFVNAPGDASQRNARMLAAGALVPLSHGRLGRSWRHAKGLEDIANELISSPDRLGLVEEYWEEHKVQEEDMACDVGPDSALPSPQLAGKPYTNGYKRTRALSDPAAFPTSSHTLSSHHPATSLPKVINQFGPLIFPLYRAALLRKRVLLVGDPPVQQNCNLVYDLSILSAVPPSLLSLLPVDGIPPIRPRSLFNVGLQDIPSLGPFNQGPASSKFLSSWIACTTDEVLATKPAFYDVLVRLSPSLPSPSSWPALPLLTSYPDQPAIYPKIYASTAELSRIIPANGIKATQRDLRRYLALRSSLSCLSSTKRPGSSSRPSTTPMERGRPAPSAENGDVEIADDASVTSTSTSSSTLSRAEQVVEAQPLGRIVYDSFVWWASAGAKRPGFSPDDDEDEDWQAQQDRALLVDSNEELNESREDISGLGKEMAVIGFFHRLTALLFTGVSDAISRTDGEGFRRGGETSLAHDRDEVGAGAGLGLTTQGGGENDGENNGEQEVDEIHDEDEPLLPAEAMDRASSDPELDWASADVEITSADMAAMGLDVWSSGDRAFVEELVMLWWGRRAVVRGGVVQCCGIRVL